MKKRILSILLTLCMVLMLCPATAFADVPPDILIGDIDFDGEVTVKDAVCLQNYLEGLESFESLPEDVLIVADFNGDGVVNYSDLTKLQRHLELLESGITVTNGKATACGTEIGKAASHTRVTLTADAPSENMEFDKWIVNEGGVTLADASSATTTFTMPAVPVCVTATYKPSSADETDGIAITLTVPFTTTVTLGDAGEPGETTFELELINGWSGALTDDNVDVTAAVTTDGAGDFTSEMTITGPEETLWRMLSEGAFVQQVDDGEAGWTVDDTVWGVLMEEIPVAYAMGDDATASGYTVYVVPASIDGNGYYYIDWENLQAADMAFTNTYTAHDYALNHNADGHWDECSGCKDKQNEEPHEYGDWKVIKAATQTAKGEKEHTCTICGYTEKAEIAKLPATDTTDTTKNNQNTGAATSPNTGDNSHMALWIALLFASGAVVIGTTVYSKRKRVR